MAVLKTAVPKSHAQKIEVAVSRGYLADLGPKPQWALRKNYEAACFASGLPSVILEGVRESSELRVNFRLPSPNVKISPLGLNRLEELGGWLTIREARTSTIIGPDGSVLSENQINESGSLFGIDDVSGPEVAWEVAQILRDPSNLVSVETQAPSWIDPFGDLPSSF